MNDLPALVWAANLADLELHTFLHRAPAIGRPTALAFDLDPGHRRTWSCAAASASGCALSSIRWDFKPSPTLPGSKGLQILVPRNTATTYGSTKTYARALAERLEREHSEQVVSRMQKALRTGKVLIDWSQNDEHKTTVNVYSLRAQAQPTVSTPVTWPEVEAVAKKGDASRLVFDSDTVLKRVKKQGDLFSPLLTLKQRLPNLQSIA